MLAAAPSSYKAGITLESAAVADGWPRNGLLTTTKHATGGVTQELVNNIDASTTGPALRMARTGLAGGATWSPWSGQGVALTYQNGWTNFGSSFRTGSAMITEDDMVVLGGVLAPGTVVAGTVITTLPSHMRPASQHALFGHSPTGPSHFDLLANGDLVLRSIPSSTTWVSLDGMSFRR